MLRREFFKFFSAVPFFGMPSIKAPEKSPRNYFTETFLTSGLGIDARIEIYRYIYRTNCLVDYFVDLKTSEMMSRIRSNPYFNDSIWEDAAREFLVCGGVYLRTKRQRMSSDSGGFSGLFYNLGRDILPPERCYPLTFPNDLRKVGFESEPGLLIPLRSLWSGDDNYVTYQHLVHHDGDWIYSGPWFAPVLEYCIDVLNPPSSRKLGGNSFQKIREYFETYDGDVCDQFKEFCYS